MHIFSRCVSEIDGVTPVRLVLSWDSRNVKTGSALQCWILTDELSPIEAIRQKRDKAICGDCVLRHNLKGGCYVLPFQAPNAIWKSKNDQGFPSIKELKRCSFLRMGAYGDPAAIPQSIWYELFSLLPDTLPIVGYTHQWAEKRFSWLSMYCKASTKSLIEDNEAISLGFTTYRIQRPDEQCLPDAIDCLSKHAIQCEDCLLCAKNKNITIQPHGSRRLSI